MIRDPFDGSHGHLAPPPCERVARGARTNRRAPPDRPEWAQDWGIIARLHLLGIPDRKQAPVRAHGIAEAG
jgi:hypothetical protein